MLGAPPRPRAFDCVKWTREIRDRAYERTKHMSHEERRQQLNEGLQSDPFFSRLSKSRIVRPHRSREPSDGTGPSPTGGQQIMSDTLTDRSERKMDIHEIIFEVTEAPDGGYDARALGYDIFTQGDDWDDLKQMVRDAVRCHFDDAHRPTVIRLHFVRHEAIAVEAPVKFSGSRSRGRETLSG